MKQNLAIPFNSFVGGPDFFFHITEQKTIPKRTILFRIKERHNQIYKRAPFIEDDRPLRPVYTTARRTDEMITKREMDVLSLLSKGFQRKKLPRDLASVRILQKATARASLEN